MYSNSNTLLRTALLSLGLSIAVLPLHAGAAGTKDLADGPLASSTTTAILPNIMMDLDNSGSMNWDYMPDYVRYPESNALTKWCKGNTNGGALITCEPGDPPYYASGFNGLYYNPDVSYNWPVNADGTRKKDQNNKTSYATDWTKVVSDGYNIQTIDNSVASAGGSPCTSAVVGGNCPTFAASDTINLETGYPERVWCKASNDNVNGTNCKSALEGSTYKYPDGTYKVMKVKRGGPFYYRVNVEWCKTADNSFGKAGTCQAKKDSTYKFVRYFNWSRVNIGLTSLTTKHPSRTDCAGAICTAAEEKSNFATWYAWYRSRMQMTKSAIGHAFSDIRGTHKTGNDLLNDKADPDFLHARVGFTSINDPVVVNIANFDASHKADYYASLYAAKPLGGTPLRDSLDRVGKIYAGTNTSFTDPLQYSCQKNFAILATDGYWSADGYSGVGDTDSATTVSFPSRDKNKASNTLSDIAYHYYHTDLRTGCTGPDNLCENNVPASGTNAAMDDVAQHQHMTTFTISLGLDGTLTYDPNYKTATSGDFFNIKQGTLSWPIPTAGAQTTIDDLWHTAVNGRGTYFSTRDPSALEDGLKRALNSIDRVTGSGAAAATSNLQPTAGDNFIYIATYRTVKWDGELSAYSIDLTSGAISAKAVWQAEPLLKTKIAATGSADTRKIYTATGNTRVNFSAGTGGMSSTQIAYFNNANLSQYDNWNLDQKLAATPARLIDALRGQDRYENQDRPSDYGAYQRLYRDRDNVMGDIVHAQPIYVKVPPHNFADEGYSAFQIANAERAATVYAPSNDGMLHAFDGVTGEERWAYVPPIVLPELWRLADENYGNKHRFYLDGPVTISDAKINGVWKTVLIGALGKGGRGYYALDVTNPTDPKPLWNFTADENNNVGYSFGTPFITKLASGKWVAIVTSGYNNVPENGKYSLADGKGYVFVLDLATGAVDKTINTGVGDNLSPSGLARLNVQVRNFDIDATAIGAYGGDLLGNMWRFDLETGTATKVAAFGINQPITVAPEIAEVSGKTGIFFGTGSYLGKEDLGNTKVQSIYGIKDDPSVIITDRTKLVEQTVTAGANETRNISTNAVNWTTQNGWVVDLPDSGERVNIDPQLYFGTLLFATTVPSATACQPGGYSWLYQLNYQTGGNTKPFVNGGTNNVAGGKKYTSPVVGMTVSKLPNGTPIVYAITADGKKPEPDELNLPPGDDPEGTKRVLWRELSE